MTDLGLFDSEPPQPTGPGRRRAPKKKKPIIPLLLVLIVTAGILGGGYFGAAKIIHKLKGPEDYEGQGSGEAVIEVVKGDTAADIGRSLRAENVVASVEAFINEANLEPEMSTIQPGFYQLRKKMSARWAVKELIDPANRVEGKVVIPEGFRVGQVLERIAEKTDIKLEDLEAAFDKPESIGLPDYAEGNVEGYFFPATYTIAPGASAEDVLSQMVAKTAEVLGDLDVESRAAKLGFTPEEIVTIASIMEYEVNRDEDYAKVARVIYNRLDKNMALQMDSTVSYLSKRKGDPWTTPEERENPSEYNTYKHPGLPPGPIGAPGKKTLEAALDPAEGNWLYFVADFENGGTVFSDNLADHERAANKARKYCRENPDVC